MTTPQNTPQVLVVDDEEMVLSALQEVLRQTRCEVVALADPILALEEFRRREYAVVLSDQRMPGLTGLEFLARVRQLNPETTRILVTGAVSLETVIEAINQGEIYRFIVKPWLREELLATIENGVQRYELIRQNARLHVETKALNERLTEANRALAEQLQRVSEQNAELARLTRALEDSSRNSIELFGQTMRTLERLLVQHPR